MIAFEDYLASSEPYVAAIEAAGDEPWFRSPEKLAKLEQRIPGISQMSPEDRRRALFMRHRGPR